MHNPCLLWILKPRHNIHQSCTLLLKTIFPNTCKLTVTDVHITLTSLMRCVYQHNLWCIREPFSRTFGDAAFHAVARGFVLIGVKVRASNTISLYSSVACISAPAYRAVLRSFLTLCRRRHVRDCDSAVCVCIWVCRLDVFVWRRLTKSPTTKTSLAHASKLHGRVDTKTLWCGCVVILMIFWVAEWHMSA